MNKFIGIHQAPDGQIWTEVTEASDVEEATEKLERNDTNLMVLYLQEAKRLFAKLAETLNSIENDG